MGERERYDPGTFSWVELSTSDVEWAKGFYTGLFGWETEDQPLPDGGAYTIARVGGRDVAGLTPAQPGQPPAWNSYVTVEDAGAAASNATELGGNIVVEPFDVMEEGRMAVIQDPTGAFFCVWQPRNTIGAGLVNGHGLLSLNQLNTNDPERAIEFYSALFGWSFDAVPDSEIPYWGVRVGDRLGGGMMLLPADAPAPPHWLVYFGIDDIDAASGKIGESGGALLVEKMAVPGGEIVVAQDPQGAAFALVAGRFDD
jgi:predicted enzyme related to lactoylglutathione lyase